MSVSPHSWCRVMAAVACTALLALAPWTAAAQSAPATPAPDQADRRPGEIQRLFDAYFVMEAQQALGLSDTQYPPFLTRLRSLRSEERRVGKEC